jgi:hypothetical protein
MDPNEAAKALKKLTVSPFVDVVIGSIFGMAKRDLAVSAHVEAHDVQLLDTIERCIACKQDGLLTSARWIDFGRLANSQSEWG